MKKIKIEKLSLVDKPEDVLCNSNSFFENLASLVSVEDFCRTYRYSHKTIYDWRYRPKKNHIPKDLFLKIRGRLFVDISVWNNFYLRDLSEKKGDA